MSLSLHFPDSGWETVTQDWSAWWAGELERAQVVLECVEPQDEANPHYASTFLSNFAIETPADELLGLFIPRLQATHYLGDAFPRFWHSTLTASRRSTFHAARTSQTPWSANRSRNLPHSSSEGPPSYLNVCENDFKNDDYF